MIENIKKSYPIVLPVEPVFFSNANDFYQNRLKYQQNRNGDYRYLLLKNNNQKKRTKISRVI